MWDIYKNGMRSGGHSSRVDVVKGVAPAFLGRFFFSHLYPNHGKQEIEFDIPEETDGDTLVDAEVRIVTNEIRALNVGFQIFQKGADWVFLDAKSVPPEGDDWVSLRVTPGVKESRRISFLIFSTFNSSEGRKRSKLMKYLQPILLLSYVSRGHQVADQRTVRGHNDSVLQSRDARALAGNVRQKRSLYEDYEEETNRIWEGEAAAGKRQKARNTCRRKPLYVDFSEIDYDTWIVAPTGYEAFQCVGKCTFPVGENLSPTKHAIVQTLMHHVSPTKVGRACCVPTRLDPISVLYVDSKGILTYRFRYQDMVVAECGCR